MLFYAHLDSPKMICNLFFFFFVHGFYFEGFRIATSKHCTFPLLVSGKSLKRAHPRPLRKTGRMLRQESRRSKHLDNDIHNAHLSDPVLRVKSWNIEPTPSTYIGLDPCLCFFSGSRMLHGICILEAQLGSRQFLFVGVGDSNKWWTHTQMGRSQLVQTNLNSYEAWASCSSPSPHFWTIYQVHSMRGCDLLTSIQ